MDRICPLQNAQLRGAKLYGTRMIMPRNGVDILSGPPMTGRRLMTAEARLIGAASIVGGSDRRHEDLECAEPRMAERVRSPGEAEPRRAVEDERELFDAAGHRPLRYFGERQGIPTVRG